MTAMVTRIRLRIVTTLGTKLVLPVSRDVTVGELKRESPFATIPFLYDSLNFRSVLHSGVLEVSHLEDFPDFGGIKVERIEVCSNEILTQPFFH
jgi:hypothetical protein